LEEAFAENMYPNADQRELLVKRSQLDEDKIIVGWLIAVPVSITLISPFFRLGSATGGREIGRSSA